MPDRQHNQLKAVAIAMAMLQHHVGFADWLKGSCGDCSKALRHWERLG